MNWARGPRLICWSTLTELLLPGGGWSRACAECFSGSSLLLRVGLEGAAGPLLQQLKRFGGLDRWSVRSLRPTRTQCDSLWKRGAWIGPSLVQSKS